MRKISHFLFLALLLIASAIPLKAVAQEATEVLMPQFGMLTDGIVKVTDEIVFKDYKGDASIQGTSSCNSLAAIVFQPEQAGKAIQITFETIEVKPYGTSGNYPAYLNVYNGILVPEDSYVWPSTTSEVKSSSKLPDGELIETLSGTYTDKTYVSTDPSGALSVGFHFVNATTCSGWVAKVKAITVSDMEVTGAGGENTHIVAAPTGRTGIALAGFYVDAEGILNPENLTSVSFSVPMNENVIDPASLKLYAGTNAEYGTAEPIATTISETGGVYTMTLAQPLKDGRNSFTIAGDVKDEAEFGAKVQVNVTGVTTTANPSGVTGFATADPVEVTLPYMVLMSAGPVTYTVGANDILFYDDGGKDGKISYKFEGSVTFAPSTPGKIVQIEFINVGLYEGSYSSTNDDILKVYNGREVVAANLNEQVFHNKPILIRSMADDGSLTVYLKSVTSEYYIGQGFEAIVSEYLPAQMTVTGIEAAQPEGTVCAGDKDQAILSVNIKTQDVIALTAQSLKFTTEGTTDLSHIEKATVYYTAKSDEFSTAVKFGEAVPTGLTEFTVPGTQTLVEGDNYFWLAYDIAPQASNGEFIDAGVVSATLSDGEHTVDAGSPTGNRTVENTVISVLGTQEKTVYGTWMFKSEDNPLSYYSGYNPVQGDQITIFKPGTDGMVIELDIQSFALYYASSSSSYYPQAKFEVYSGNGTSGELLWALTSADVKDIGPNRILRSKSADGALTVVFDAKTTSSSYTAAGWTAEVREYLSRPMTVASVAASQTSTDVVSVGNQDQDIIGFNVKTEGDKDAPALSEVVIGLKGSQSSITKVNLYTSGAENTPAKETAIASVAVSADNTNATLVLENPVTLLEGDNYFRVTYDISDEAAVESVIDAELVSVKVGNASVSPTDGAGDPEGSRTIKNIYLMQPGENGEIIVGDQALVFYDNGGPDDVTPNGFTGTVTFAPKDPGKVVKLAFKQWDIFINASMLVYYGGAVATKEDVKLTKTSGVPDYLVSTSEDGKITIKFTASTYQSNGWEIEVSQYEQQALNVTSVKAESVAPMTVMKGMTETAMLRVEVEISGDKGELELTGAEVATDGSTENAVGGISIFTTDQTDSFAPTNRVMHASETPYALTGSYKITNRGTYRFWVACDVATTAAPFDAVKLAINSITISGTNYVPETAATAASSVKEGLSGTYTVGEDGDFATIQAAIDAISEGIDGPVVINVKKGEYNERVTVPDIPGTSSNNTITLQSESGNRDDVVIYHNTYYKPTEYADYYGVFTFDGVDYFTLKDVTVTTTSTAYCSVVHFKNQSRHATIDNCHVYAPVPNPNDYSNGDINLLYQYALSEENKNNDYWTVRNSLLEGGHIGVRISGTNQVNPPLPLQRGALIENNTIRNNGTKAIYAAAGEIDMVIRGNVIEYTGTAYPYRDFKGMDLRNTVNPLIENNSIYISSNCPNGISISSITTTEDKPCRIINNEVAVENTTTSTSSSYYPFGIKISGAAQNTDIAHNTILVSAKEGITTPGGVALYLNDALTNVTVRNNILMEKEGGYVYRFCEDEYVAGATYSNNVAYTTGTTFAKTSSSTSYATFDEWAAVSNETGSFDEEVLFLSSSILYPAETGNLQHGMPLAFVPTDKDGTTRSTETPTIGAYEYDESTEAPAYMEGYPAFGGITNVSATASLKATMNGTAFTLVKPASEPAPTEDELWASESMTELRKGIVSELEITGLERQTEYKLYSLLMSLNGLGISEVLESEVFTTSYDPTAVSTFEAVTTTTEGFEDGTAAFAGFTVETIADAVVSGTKAAKVGENATITFTNSDKGIPLTGFFLKADAEVTLTVYDRENQPHAYTLPATDGEWLFMNLKDKGMITKVEMATTGEALIDNFSGMPNALSVTTADQAANEGDNVTLAATATGGVYPLTYIWTNALREELAASSGTTIEVPHTAAYTVTVTDGWGTTVAKKSVVTVEGSAYTATFDDNYLDPESYYNGEGEDNGDWTNPGTDSKFYSGSYAFSTNHHTQTWWGGIGLSNITSTTYAGLTDQFNSAVGHGYDNSANYAVIYTGSYPVEVTNNATEGDDIRGFYITNTAWVVDAVENGDGMSNVPGGFQQGDYLKLTVTGTKADATKATVDCYLADYRSENEVDHYYLDSWQWLDLRSLGKVTKLTFSMTGTKKNTYGLTSPTYFCMDNLNGYREIEDGETQVIGLSEKEIDLAQFFTLDNDGSAVAYAITDAYDETVAEIVLDGGTMAVTGMQDMTATEVIVSATQKGKIQFVRIPLSVNEALSGIESGATVSVAIYPVPVTDRLNIRTAMEEYTIEIIAANGANVFVQAGNHGNTAINVGHLAKGVYILRMYNEKQTVTKRFTVK